MPKRRSTPASGAPLPISVIVIAKNEEKTLGFCLESFRNRVAEIIVCDTGSRDRTKRIARKHGARLLQRRLSFDFSKLRNSLLNEATQPWIISLDADERIAGIDWPRLAHYLKRRNVDAFLFPRRNYYASHPNLLSDLVLPCRGEYPLEESFSGCHGFYMTHKILLFRNRAELRYRYPVHESIVPAIRKHGLRMEPADVPVHHFELHKGWNHHLRKHARYAKELRRSLREEAGGGYLTNANLAADLFLHRGATREAVSVVRRLTDRLAPREPLAWRLRGALDLSRGRPGSARVFFRKAFGFRSNAVDSCLLGWSCLRLNDWKDARRWLDRSLKLNPMPLTYNLKGVLEAAVGEDRRALKYFLKARAMNPLYPDPLLNSTLVSERLRKQAGKKS